MSDSNVLVNFRLRDQPLRIKWMATDGVPGDGYKAQVTTIILPDGTRLGMDSSSILEQTAPDAAGGLGAYLVTFNGIVGYAADHPDHLIVEGIEDGEIDYELDFVHEEDARTAIEGEDYRIVEHPRATVTKLTRRDAP